MRFGDVNHRLAVIFIFIGRSIKQSFVIIPRHRIFTEKRCSKQLLCRALAWNLHNFQIAQHIRRIHGYYQNAQCNKIRLRDTLAHISVPRYMAGIRATGAAWEKDTIMILQRRMTFVVSK